MESGGAPDSKDFKLSVESKSGPPADWSGYKSHPLFLIVSAVVATAGAMSTLVFPVMSARLQNRIDALEADASPLRARVISAESRAAEAVRAKDVAELKARELELRDLFPGENVLPAGWPLARIGDTQQSVDSLFPEKQVNPFFWMVHNSKHPVFETAAYYFDDRPPSADRQVTHILLFFEHGAQASNRSLVIDQLTQKWGSPERQVEPDDGRISLIWDTGAYVLLVDNSGLHIEPTCDAEKEIALRGLPTQHLRLCNNKRLPASKLLPKALHR